MNGAGTMFDFKRAFVGAMLVAAAACGSTAANAATVIGTLQSFGVGDTITLHGVRPNGSTFASQVLNGISVFSRTGGTETSTLAGSGGNSFFAFCVEPYEDAQLNANYTFTVDPVAQAAKSSIANGIGAAKALQIAQLFGNYAPDLTVPMSAIQASAIQVALWEIVSELPTNPLDVTSGNTYFSTPGSANTPQVMSLAQTYLNYVSTAGSSAPVANGLKALTINGNQDFLVQTVSAAPEPGTWLMMLLGFGLTGYSLRRRPAKLLAVAG
jgi:hypothetical protein